jgi:hypothetical protein
LVDACAEDHRVRKPQDSLKKFHQDLTRIGLRARRGHDLRRTFVTLICADGGRTDILRPITHPGEKDIIGLYTTFPWPVVCEELLKLRIPILASTTLLPHVPGTRTTHPEYEVSNSSTAEGSTEKQIADAPTDVAGYTPSYTPECSPQIPNDVDALRAAGGMGLPFRKT